MMRNEPFIGVRIFGTAGTAPFTATAMVGDAGLVVAVSILGVPVAFSFTSSVGILCDRLVPPTVSTTMRDRATPAMSELVIIGGETKLIVEPEVGPISDFVLGPGFGDVA